MRIPGLAITEHELAVPLDRDDPARGAITLFAREVADPDGADRPFLLYLQGGPGHESPRPADLRSIPWLERALEDFRVLLLDQRGTGRSTPVGVPPGAAEEQAAYLRLFRADAIVADCEALRSALGSPPWSVLGQSFGGLIATCYLSRAPDGLREVFITGGLPPIGPRIDAVYRATWVRTLERNRRYFERYPGDRERLRELRARLDAGDVVLPTGERLTWRRFAQAGGVMGMSAGLESLHHLVELPPDSPAFVHDVAAATAFARHPLYAVLHEACWADGGATRWAAQRTQPVAYEHDPELLTGEQVFPWMFEDYAALAPLREAAELLADHGWPSLYDRDALAANDVPVAAAIYTDDMYVERAFSEETAALIGGLRPWVTSEYEHNGLRADGARILDRLIMLTRGRA